MRDLELDILRSVGVKFNEIFGVSECDFPLFNNNIGLTP